MAATVAKAAPAIHGNSFAPRMAKAAIDCKSPETSGDVLVVADEVSLLLEVLHDKRIEPKQACDYMQMARSKFTRITTGEAQPTWSEVYRLPDTVWHELQQRIAAAKGLTAENKKQARMALIRKLVDLLVEEAAS